MRSIVFVPVLLEKIKRYVTTRSSLHIFTKYAQSTAKVKDARLPRSDWRRQREVPQEILNVITRPALFKKMPNNALFGVKGLKCSCISSFTFLKNIVPQARFTCDVSVLGMLRIGYGTIHLKMVHIIVFV